MYTHIHTHIRLIGSFKIRVCVCVSDIQRFLQYIYYTCVCIYQLVYKRVPEKYVYRKIPSVQNILPLHFSTKCHYLVILDNI